MNILRLLTILLALLALGYVTGNAQTECPADKVCLSRDAAIKALQDSDELKAVKAENATLKEARNTDKEVITNLKVELAKVSGEKSQLEQQAVRMDAIVEILIRNARPKKIGLINLF